MVIMFGTVEIGLTDGKRYQYMDLLGKGSIIGFNGIITETEWVYTAKVTSKRANIVQLNIEALAIEIKYSPFLQAEVN